MSSRTSREKKTFHIVPFIKELKGYDENLGSQNKLLESFIKEMNKKPLDMVDDFLTKDKKKVDQDCPAPG